VEAERLMEEGHKKLGGEQVEQVEAAMAQQGLGAEVVHKHNLELELDMALNSRLLVLEVQPRLVGVAEEQGMTHTEHHKEISDSEEGEGRDYIDGRINSQVQPENSQVAI